MATAKNGTSKKATVMYRPGAKSSQGALGAGMPRYPPSVSPSSAPSSAARQTPLLERLRGPHSRRYFLLFLGTAVVIQGLHDMEHIVQSYQVFFMGVPRPVAGGLLGSVFDFPVVHFLYNILFFLALIWAVAWAYGLGGFRTFDKVGMWALLIAAGVQSYHAVEHILQITQEAATGTARPPGAIGLVGDNIVAHLILNTFVFVLPLIALWRFGGVRVMWDWVSRKRLPAAA
jgi:hypothetical protein